MTGLDELSSKSFLKQFSVSLPVEELPARATACATRCDRVHGGFESIGVAAAITEAPMAMTYMQVTAITR